MASDLMTQIKRIQDEILQKAEDILVDEVSSEVIKEGQKQVAEEVYAKYAPKRYERTYGLMTEWDVERIDGGIKVRNTREEDGRYIPEIIETGKGYDYEGYGYAYEKPRSFIAKTKSEIKRKGNYIKILKKELGKRVDIR